MSANDDTTRKRAAAGAVEKAKARFAKFTAPEVELSHYLEVEKSEVSRQAALAQNPSLTYQPSVGTITVCGNGDLETQLDPAEWQGAYGTIPNPVPVGPRPGQSIVFANLTAGILSGTIAQGVPTNQATQAHQTWVAAAPDPILAASTPPVTIIDHGAWLCGRGTDRKCRQYLRVRAPVENVPRDRRTKHDQILVRGRVSGSGQQPPAQRQTFLLGARDGCRRQRHPRCVRLRRR
jgi:hypothetical protein